MREYEVIGAKFGVQPGAIVGFPTAEQAFNRRPPLTRPKDGGHHEVLVAFEFKHGERFYYDGEIPKSLAKVVEPAGQGEAQAREEVTVDPVVVEPALGARGTGRRGKGR